jgi:hypothetical protein
MRSKVRVLIQCDIIRRGYTPEVQVIDTKKTNPFGNLILDFHSLNYQKINFSSLSHQFVMVAIADYHSC